MPRVKKTFLFGFLMANIVASCSILDAELIKPMLSSNGNHTCALTAAGSVICWGRNDNGQVNNGTSGFNDVLTATAISGLTDRATWVAAGMSSTCAVTKLGAAQCWGTFSGTGVVVPVKGLEEGVTAVASGFSHHCALVRTGAVLCWGYNDQGELGNGTTTATLNPIVATGLEKGVKAISASRYQTCALTSAGTVLCWGVNLNGSLGIPGNRQSSIKVPTAIPGLPAQLIAIAAGTTHACAITTEGAVWCWGASLAAPQAVSGLPSGVTAISTQDAQACALTRAGSVLCWVPGVPIAPKMVPGLDRDVTAISVGGEYACAVLSKGTVKCWGSNDLGHLGVALSVKSSTTPGAVLGLKGVGELNLLTAGAESPTKR
jgi:alpha-tubulin suppressor-like RCC1 family protein